MKYFKDVQTNEVFGFDEADESQLPYMQAKIDAGLQDITNEWPLPAPEPIAPPAPTKEQLLAEIQALTEKINSLEA